MDQYDGVFPRFDYFVEVTNRTVFDRGRERTIVPNRFIAFKKEAPRKAYRS